MLVCIVALATNEENNAVALAAFVIMVVSPIPGNDVVRVVRVIEAALDAEELLELEDIVELVTAAVVVPPAAPLLDPPF